MESTPESADDHEWPHWLENLLSIGHYNFGRGLDFFCITCNKGLYKEHHFREGADHFDHQHLRMYDRLESVVVTYPDAANVGLDAHLTDIQGFAIPDIENRWGVEFLFLHNTWGYFHFSGSSEDRFCWHCKSVMMSPHRTVNFCCVECKFRFGRAFGSSSNSEVDGSGLLSADKDEFPRPPSSATGKLKLPAGYYDEDDDDVQFMARDDGDVDPSAYLYDDGDMDPSAHLYDDTHLVLQHVLGMMVDEGCRDAFAPHGCTASSSRPPGDLHGAPPQTVTVSAKCKPLRPLSVMIPGSSSSGYWPANNWICCSSMADNDAAAAQAGELLPGRQGDRCPATEDNSHDTVFDEWGDILPTPEPLDRYLSSEEEISDTLLKWANILPTPKLLLDRSSSELGEEEEKIAAGLALMEFVNKIPAATTSFETDRGLFCFVEGGEIRSPGSLAAGGFRGFNKMGQLRIAA